MTEELVLCNEPGPAKNDLSCPREKGHKDEHYTWHQMPNHHVCVVTFEGKSVYHLNLTGKVTAEEVCTIITFLEWAKGKI